MPQQDDGGWPLGLRLLNARVGYLDNNRDFSGSISFNTLPTQSPTSFMDSSDLDSQSSGSIFDAESMNDLGGFRTMVEVSTRAGGSTEQASLGGGNNRKNYNLKSKPWLLFSLCCKLSSTDAVIVSATRTHSLAHFLEAERRRTAANCRRNHQLAERNNLLTT